ncbi:MAG: PA2779 family protein [Arenicellales bacterium]|jgi:cytochrome P450
MTQLFKKSILTPTILLFLLTILWLPAANAAVLNTGSAETIQHTATADKEIIQDFLLQETVQLQLQKMGVSPELAKARAAALTPMEQQLLQQKIADLPAGAGVVEVIGIVFIVLLILELLGVTDIFKKI